MVARRLERTDAPVDEIGWRVGYEDPAFFRRLFKRVTGLSPGVYRKRFSVPNFARGGAPAGLPQVPEASSTIHRHATSIRGIRSKAR